LLDFTDFPAGTSITVPAENDYRLGDPVVFTEEGTATIDSGLTAGTTYYVVAVTATSISVSTTAGGAAAILIGDGGTGTADTPGAANHISIKFADFATICQVQTFSIELTRDEIECTTIPCGGVSSKYAPSKSFVPGYIDSSGTMSVYFTSDQASLANRLLQNSLLKKQDGASVKLYVSAKSDGAGGISDGDSLYVAGDISIFGFSTSVAPEDATMAELNFRINSPTHIFGQDFA